MALTKIGSIGINTGIAFAGVTTIATLNASDNVLSVGGTVNFVSDVSIGGTVSIAGTLTYEDVTNVDAVGLITARDGIKVGSGITLSVDGDGFFTGVVTATSFSGDGSGLTNAGPSLTGSTDNTVVTVTGANAIQGESNLVFTGTRLGINKTSPAPLSGGGAGVVHVAASDNPEVVLERTASGTEAKASIRITDGEDFKIAVKDGSASIIDALTIDTGTGNITASGTVAATSYTGDGSSLTGISVGIATTASQVSGITTVVDLNKDDIRLDCTGLVTIDTKGGTEGNNHVLRIVNSGISTVTFSSYFKFPSGGTPALPTASGAISLISFTVHTQGRVGVASVFLAGASVNFS